MSDKRYWLFKSEPDAFSIRDLATEKDRIAHWDGVRNYQARNLLRDEVRVGDGVLFYHSSCAEPAAAGTCEVVRAGYPDHTQFDPESRYHDPKSKEEDPRWFMVDIRLESEFSRPVTLKEMREMPELEGLALLRRGQRWSIQPIGPEHWDVITKLGTGKR